MGNPEHVRILNQGVEAWNKWRADNPAVIPDLSQESFNNLNLTGIYLKKSDLHQSFFIETDLTYARISFADLSDTRFIKSKFYKTKLKYSNLSRADLQECDIFRTNLYRANLSNSNLSYCNFQSSDLIEVNLKNAKVTGANFYGTSRDDWKIDGIKCDFIFFDFEGQRRYPHNRDFRQGEFEEIYKSLPTIEYYFEQGITPIDTLLMDQVVQAINEKNPEFKLKLDNFHSRGQPHAKFTILHKDHSEKALEQITQQYKQEIKYLEGQRDYANHMMMQLMLN